MNIDRATAAKTLLKHRKPKSEHPVRVRPVVQPTSVNPETFNSQMLDHLEKELGRKPIPGRDYDCHNCIGNW